MIIKIIELFTIFIILPYLYVYFDLDHYFKNQIFTGNLTILYKLNKILLLQIIFIYTLIIYYKKIRNFLYFKIQSFKNNFYYAKWILLRFLGIITIILTFIFYVYPERLFYPFKTFPTYILIIVIIIYPLLSVIQQEFIFRIFFFERYYAFFQSKWEFYFTNALLFMFIHIIYKNYIALLFTFFGNFLFLSTFFKTRSVYWIVLEHSIYGLIIFYTSLGDFFYQTHSF